MNRRSVITIGEKFGRLTVLGYSKNYTGRTRVLCRCDCGNEKDLVLGNLKSGVTRSCGCLLLEKVKEACSTHGFSSHPLYNVWKGMIDRCSNPGCHNYKNYGGRGISVCKEWTDDISSFISWSINNNYSKGLQLDRVDNDGNYGPDNCRFVSPNENQRNKRTCVYYEYDGKRLTLVEWSELFNIQYDRLYMRLKNGWSFKDAVSVDKKINQFI